jgi:Zn-dependent protease
MILSLMELLDILLMSLVVGYIFMGIFKFTQDNFQMGFDWRSFKFAVLVTAPAIILHELGHKFAALSFGFNATFHAAYTWLGIGVLLRVLQTGFIFFVPAYVQISCVTKDCVIPPLQLSTIAFAGPFVNLTLFFICWALLKKNNLSKNVRLILYISKQINLFLFIFNMLPIPMFDGFKVYSGLWNTFF